MMPLYQVFANPAESTEEKFLNNPSTIIYIQLSIILWPAILNECLKARKEKLGKDLQTDSK